MSAKEQEIAEHLTLLDFSIYAAIEVNYLMLIWLTFGPQPPELLNQAWNNYKLKYRAPNVLSLINRANSVSYWVASMILWQEKPKDRKKVTEKFIIIGEVC